MQIWIHLFLLIILLPNSKHTVSSDFTSILRDNNSNAIDITSQGEYTFILRSDFKIYKWNGTAFVFFQGPVNAGLDYPIRGVTVTELGVIWVCADNYNKLFKYINSAWTLISSIPCYNVKIGYGPLSKLYLGKEGDTTYNSNRITFLNSSNGFTEFVLPVTSTNKMFTFSSDNAGMNYY